MSIIISKKYSETKAKSTHTPTHRLASTVTHVHRYIERQPVVSPISSNSYESFKLFSSTDVNTFYEERRIRLLIDVYL